MFILDALSSYTPSAEREAQRLASIRIILDNVLLLCSICERVTPRLSHANAAVVLSAVKVLMKLMELLPTDGTFIESLHRKLAPPLGKHYWSLSECLL